MAHFSIDGNIRATFIPACANIAAPTVAELTAAGIAELAAALTPDGLNVNVTEDNKDTTTLASTFNGQAPGRAGGDIALTYFRDTVGGSDKPYTTLKRFTAGFLVIRLGVLNSTAYATSDKVRVYPITCGLQKDVPAAKNTDWQISQSLYVTADWNIDAVVA